MEGQKQVTFQRPDHFSFLKRMREQNQLCDITIVVENHEFPAHKCILVGTISYFRKIFLNNLEESSTEKLSIEGVTAENMDDIITFAYTGQIVLREGNVQSLMKDVDFLELSDIKHECEQFLISNLHWQNSCEMHHFADNLNCISLKERSYKFMCQHLRDTSKTEDFLGIDHILLKGVVTSSDSSFLPLTDRFESVIRWIINNFDERKVYLSELLQSIRFFELTSDYILNYICTNEVIAAVTESEHRNFVGDIMSLYQSSKIQSSKDIAISKNHDPNKIKGCIVVLDDINGQTIEIYDPNIGEWKSIETALINRTSSGCTLYEGRLYVVGEFNNREVSNTAKFYDFQANEWRLMPSMNVARWEAKVAGLDDYLYVCGGTEPCSSAAFLNVVERCSLVTGEWESISSMKEAHFSSAVVTLQGHVYAIGGLGCDESFLSSVERYNPRTDEWVILRSMHEKRGHTGAAVLNERIYVCGGIDDSQRTLDSVEFYDPNDNRWRYAATMNMARSYPLVVSLLGKLWVIGGCDGKNLDISSVEVYDPDKDSWSYITSMPKTRGPVCGGVFL